MRRYPCLALALALALAACADAERAPIDRPALLDTLQLGPALGVDTTGFTKRATNLYYKDLEEGSGPPVERHRQVAVHLVGRLPDGTLVEDTHTDGQPLVFSYGVGHVMRGLDLGMEGMKGGSTRRIIVPPSMAYGVQGNEEVPPYSPIIFDVTVVGIR